MKTGVSNWARQKGEVCEKRGPRIAGLALSLDFGCWMLLTFSECKTAKGVRFAEAERVAAEV